MFRVVTKTIKIMKKRRLDISRLKVQSFVTDLQDEKARAAKGGYDGGAWHTARHHNCSEIYCYSDFCTGGPASDNCPV